jgi:myo-inositol-1(or 4)-monophosphatase
MMRQVTQAEFDRFIGVGSEAAKAAGRLIMSHFRTRFAVSYKGETDLVTEVDIAAEKLIVSALRREFPAHIILAEEGTPGAERGEFTWVIDPLDGTTNYAHGFPVFAVSIGLEIAGEVAWGAVYNPVLDEFFTARSGGGAFCNGAPLRVSSTALLGDSFLATGFPYDIRTSSVNNLDNFCAFAVRSRAIRRAGSAALDLCYVAAGRFDGFWELKLHPWDCAAGYLMVREAGGKVTDFSGSDASIYFPECIASNGLIHEQMLMIFRDMPSLTMRGSG